MTDLISFLLRWQQETAHPRKREWQLLPSLRGDVEVVLREIASDPAKDSSVLAISAVVTAVEIQSAKFDVLLLTGKRLASQLSDGVKGEPK